MSVEVLFLRCRGEGLAFRTVQAPLEGTAGPDPVARSLCGAGQALRVLHSTSWRHVPGRGVVLTYVALPDPEPAARAEVLVDPSIVSSGDPLRPGPDELHPHHVAAHAVRHLGELAARDPAVRAAAACPDPDEQELWRRVRAVAATMPTDTHEAAHAAARSGHGRA